MNTKTFLRVKTASIYPAIILQALFDLAGTLYALRKCVRLDPDLIIGAGVAGLCAGIYGQMNGYRTRIVEQHKIPPAGWRQPTDAKAT